MLSSWGKSLHQVHAQQQTRLCKTALFIPASLSFYCACLVLAFGNISVQLPSSRFFSQFLGFANHCSSTPFYCRSTPIYCRSTPFYCLCVLIYFVKFFQVIWRQNFAALRLLFGGRWFPVYFFWLAGRSGFSVIDLIFPKSRIIYNSWSVYIYYTII